MLSGCSLSDDPDQNHVIGDFKNGFLEYREKETGDGKQELTPMQEELVEALVWFKKTNCAIPEALKAKSSALASCSARQFVKPPLWCFVPKKRRGCGDGFLSEKGPRSSTGTSTVDELGFLSKKIHGTTCSVDEVANPLGIPVPEKKRGISKSYAERSHYHHYICSNAGGLKIKIQRQEERKAAAGKKRISKRQRIDNEDGQEGQGERPYKKRKKMGRVDFKKLGLYPAPDFSSQIKARIDHQEGRDSEIKLRIMKQVFRTDMSMHHDRFSMPLNQINGVKDFLRRNEIEGTEVRLVEMGFKDDSSVHQSTMRLRKWHINSNISYVLASNWSDFLKRNEGALKENDIVQVYSFRRDGKLWCVLAKVMDADDVARVTSAAERSAAEQALHGSRAREEGATTSQA
ncbi:hypothetical protein OIU84_017939 [Salix udensis]|uniref:B3 domain-containing protein n=1 Tax=Salix udensis TaxID=889485 RepID=A0AAD6L371_9ROSI|nr:hypothetical protein OIU84_017939 [Salix udensis]